MQQNKTLAIMAAGLGTRFGSLKQLHPINLKGYAIIDYSIYDAISVGFKRIIFIVRDEILDQFKKRYENVLPNSVSVEFVLQRSDAIPKPYKTNRTKPWGTGHALLILKDKIRSPFVLINADDFYGKEAFKLIFDALYKNDSEDNYFAGYQLDKTLSESGYVSRGECFVDDSNCLTQIIERPKIQKQKDGTIVYIDSKSIKIEISPKTIVSMNFWGFTPNIFSIAETLFKKFIEKNVNNDNAEFYLPYIVDQAIKNKQLKFKVLPTSAQWYGITYNEDKHIITSKIKAYTEQELYPEVLW